LGGYGDVEDSLAQGAGEGVGAGEAGYDFVVLPRTIRIRPPRRRRNVDAETVIEVAHPDAPEVVYGEGVGVVIAEAICGGELTLFAGGGGVAIDAAVFGLGRIAGAFAPEPEIAAGVGGDGHDELEGVGGIGEGGEGGDEIRREGGEGEQEAGGMGGIAAGDGRREDGQREVDAREEEVFGEAHPVGREDGGLGGGRGWGRGGGEIRQTDEGEEEGEGKEQGGREGERAGGRDLGTPGGGDRERAIGDLHCPPPAVYFLLAS